jgi:phenol hydroxylase P4 protein
MPVYAITPEYQGETKDIRANFHGNILVFIGWDHHQLFCAPKAFPLPPETLFSDLISKVMPQAFAQHPEFNQIQWKNADWLLDNAPFTPDWDKSLEAQGFGHKSLIRFNTPELKGVAAAGI